MKESSRERLL